MAGRAMADNLDEWAERLLISDGQMLGDDCAMWHSISCQTSTIRCENNFMLKLGLHTPSCHPLNHPEVIHDKTLVTKNLGRGPKSP